MPKKKDSSKNGLLSFIDFKIGGVSQFDCFFKVCYLRNFGWTDFNDSFPYQFCTLLEISVFFSHPYDVTNKVIVLFRADKKQIIKKKNCELKLTTYFNNYVYLNTTTSIINPKDKQVTYNWSVFVWLKKI